MEAIRLPSRFDKAIIDTEGSDVNVVLNASAAMGEEVARWTLGRMNALTVSNARGEDLDRRIYDLYGIVRGKAQSAVVTLQLTRSGTTGVTVVEGSRFGTDSGVVFRTLTSVAFAQGNLGPLSVVAVAERAGQTGNVGEGTVVRILSALGDSTIAVTNLEVAAGGAEAQSDDDYRAEARDYFINAVKGVLSAIEYGAKQIDGISKATAVEDLDAGVGSPNGRVSLYISDDDGQANTALGQFVEDELLEYRGLGVPVSVIPAIPQYVDIQVNGLLFVAGSNTTQLLDTATSAILALVNATPPGTTLRRASIYSALERVDGLIVPEGAITTPAGDLVPTTGTIIRTTRDRISLNI